MPLEIGVILGAICVGAILFFSSGFYYVKKDTVAVIERLDEFKVLHTKGIYYHLPVLHRKVATYSTKKITETISLNKQQVQIKYQINNYRTFHYKGHNIENTLCAAITKNNGEMLSTRQFLDTLESIGVTLIKEK